ncbi:MAG: hypothetical protein Udaeo2_27760 [Candidatus Udaeobacter sp.]|nr:MAG: hypothetical protein Udaeo2_27760 [Candidatus Udaeobacter sp.]
MSRPVNNAYAVAPDFFKDLIIAYSPLGIRHIKFAKHVLERFLRLMRRDPSAQTLSKQTTQTQTASNTRRRSALRADERFLLQTNRNRNAAHRILKT